VAFFEAERQVRRFHLAQHFDHIAAPYAVALSLQCTCFSPGDSAAGSWSS
jgi:hypothetical protein